MANNINNITVGKPAVGGAVYRAPLGTALPVTAKVTLDDAFEGLGYISDDGLNNNNSPESDSVKAWGGETVVNLQTEKTDTFGFKLIEVLDVEVLKTIYGEDNVTGALATGITVKANNKEQKESSWVIDMILRNGTLKRIVIPQGGVTEVGEITYADEDVTGYETTVTALPDSAGNTHYEYIVEGN